MPPALTGADDQLKITNIATFGLSKNLAVPISFKLCYLQPAPGSQPRIATSSEKYRDPALFQKLSRISVNSDLYVVVEVLDGNHSPIVEPVQSPYKAFSSNKRIWDLYIKLAVNFNQVDYRAYLRFTLMEIVATETSVFGQGTLSLFSHKDASLRKGSYKVAITPGSSQDNESVEYGPLNNMTESETNLVKYENGELTRNEWLDALALPMAEKIRQAELTSSLQTDSPSLPSHYLFVELPTFLFLIVYLDETYPLSLIVPQLLLSGDKPMLDARTTNEAAMVVNKIDIPTVPLPKLYDPDFHNMTLSHYNGVQEKAHASAGTSSQLTSYSIDPIERKFQKLATNINNNSVLDKEVKPSPQMRDELMEILNMPSSTLLSVHEKEVLWKFRYYFSKSSAVNELGTPSAPLSSTRQFLVKFLKCFNWENEYELDHVFTEIFPLWPVESIDIGDALELLSNNFNPHTLTASLRRRMIDTNVKDVNNSEETKIEKIFRFAKRLRTFAVDRLCMASPEELLLYLLQLVQALKNETPLTQDPLSKDPLREAPLAQFLIDRAIESEKLGNFFYWYVKVENEDQLNATVQGQTHHEERNIYNIVLNLYIKRLKSLSHTSKHPGYKYLKRQIHFIKQLTGLVELLRSTFRKNEATGRKAQFLQDYLADSSHKLLNFDPFPLPLDPFVTICGCYPSESSVFKSSMSPLKITFKTIINYLENSSGSTIFGGKKHKFGKYPLMFKIGDDLRQDQLVIQIITLMDQLLKNENLNLKLTPYKILPTSPITGLIQFVPNETLDTVLSKNYAEMGSSASKSARHTLPSAESTTSNEILNFLQFHSRLSHDDSDTESSGLDAPSSPLAAVTDLGVSRVLMDNYVKSCAGYCVITYLLGVGDRHLDNLLLSPNGKFWHADFGYILGRDPKPFPPLMKLPIQVIDGMGGMNHENFNLFKSYCFITYTTLRRNSNLILNLFQLMLNANIPDIQIDPTRAVEKVQDKFALEMSEEEAILHFQNLIIDSVNAFFPVVIDTLHSLAQYWRA